MNNSFILDEVVSTCKTLNNLNDAKIFLCIASKNSKNLITLDRIGYLQSEIKDYIGSIETLKKCLSITSDKNSRYAINANMAKIYNHSNEPQLSLNHSNSNLKEAFDYDTLMEISFSYYLMGNYQESEKRMRELFSRKNVPDVIKDRVAYNLGSYDLEHGDFKKGLLGFIDVGHKIKIWPESKVPYLPAWKGEDLNNKKLIIHSEGGIGDEIITVRFIEDIKQRGGHPIWIAHNKHLKEVFDRNGIETVMSIKQIDTKDAIQCQAMYLPILLNLDKQDVTRSKYLTPSDEYIEKWKKILPEGKKLAVKYSGNPYYDQDLHRSIPKEFIENIEFDGTKINLQLEPELFIEGMFNAGEYIENIEDTLAILWLCDDLVTSCTSIAHMNGAIGKRGVVCPPIACYYVWLGDAIWYESMTVVRQKKHRSWDDVFEKVNNIICERNI